MSSSINSRSRKWQITINNPIEKGFTREVIKEKVASLSSTVYWCIADEVGAGGTPHCHFFLAFANAIRFSTLLKLFEGGHFEMCNGTCEQNRDYVFKIGKHKGTDKEETNLPETREEFGEMPVERKGKRNDLDDLYDMVQAGMTASEIIKDNPSYMTRRKEIEEMIYDRQSEQFGNSFRDMDVTFVYGATGTGKTSDIVKQNGGYKNIYRVVDYKNPFDGYAGQDVIVFEEYRSQLNISTLLNAIDGHPFDLPCRYHNKVACYTKVYFTSNWALKDLYKSVQSEDSETWYALLRRIHHVKYYTGETIRNMSIKEYVDRWCPLPDTDGFMNVPEDIQCELPFN